MNKLIILVLIFISFNLFGYEWKYDEGGMCGEYANYEVDEASFYNTGSYWRYEIVNLAKAAANYWNEAGSEHHLYYDGIGSDNPEIEYNNESSGTMVAHLSSNGVCIVTSWSWIGVNSDEFARMELDPVSAHPFYFEKSLAHEFGHLLGLADIDDSDDSYYRLMNGTRYWEKHLMEDDKHGARSLYGKDDVSMITAGSFTNSNNFDRCSSKYYSTGDNDYQTYTKPVLTFQPDSTKGYDYIMTWVKSDTRQVNYKFVKDEYNSTFQRYVIGDVLGDLGRRHAIGDSITIAAPSVAMKTDGSQAMMVWIQEEGNQSLDNTNDIYYSIITTSSHTNMPSVSKVYNNSGKTSGNFKAKTVSVPVVQWIDSWSKYVIFYVTYYNDQWAVKYVVQNSNGTFVDSNGNLTEYTLKNSDNTTIYSSWNPIGIDCNQKTQTGGEACLMVFNKIKGENAYSTWSTYTDSVTTTTFKVFTPVSGTNQFIENSFDTTSYASMGTRQGYGHYSLISRPYSGNTVTNLLTRITRSAQQEIEYLTFNLYQYNNLWYFSSISEKHSNDDTTTCNANVNEDATRLGASATYNSRTGRYKFIWIKE